MIQRVLRRGLLRTNWYFLRNVDACGFHVRLRLKAPASPLSLPEWVPDSGEFKDFVRCFPPIQATGLEPLVPVPYPITDVLQVPFVHERNKFKTTSAWHRWQDYSFRSSLRLIDNQVLFADRRFRIGLGYSFLMALGDAIGDDFYHRGELFWRERALSTLRLVPRDHISRTVREVFAFQERFFSRGKNTILMPLMDSGGKTVPISLDWFPSWCQDFLDFYPFRGLQPDRSVAVAGAHLELNRLGIDPVEEWLLYYLLSR